MKYESASAFLAQKLSSKPHTYMEMLSYGVSVSPWKRLAEHCQVMGWSIVKGKKRDLTTWRVVKG